MTSPLLPRRSWSPHVHAELVGLLNAAPAGSVAVLDFDDTVLEGDISLATLRAMDARHATRWHATYFELLDTQGRGVAYPQITQWFAGHTPASFSALAADIVAEALASGTPRFRPEMVDLIAAMHTRAWDVWVVTASPAVIVEQLAQQVGIPAARVLGMRLHLDEQGRFTSEVVPPATFCEGKQQAIEQHIGRQVTLVAGDSRSDADMMAAATHGLLIDGHDADLRQQAIASGWWIQSGWHHTPPEASVRTGEGSP